MAASGPLVDYRYAASRYDSGRSLEAVVLERWRAAVERVAGDISAHSVVDVGAGTGLFSSAWEAWGAEQVVAVEPSAEMRKHALARAGRSYHVLAGDAANIPLAEASVSVSWMSAVLHHIPDTTRAATEIARVVRPGGWLLVRGFFPGLGEIPWLRHMPGRERAEARFPSVEQTRAVFEGPSWEYISSLGVPERDSTVASEAADWVEQMREADSLLTALTAGEIDAGIGELRRLGQQDVGPLVLGLVAFRRTAVSD